VSSTQLERLLGDAEDEVVAEGSEAYEQARFDDPAEREAAVGWLTANPRANAILLLLALRRSAPEAYASVPAEARAQALAAALRERAVLNDFGYVDESGDHDGEAGRALLELGQDAVAALRPELDDLNKAQLEGSEAGALVRHFGLRRADLAYRYLMRILGRVPELDPDPAVRDREIAALREELDRA